MDEHQLSGYVALIRTYNSALVIANTVRSLSHQTLPPDSYVFVDSGSTDGTQALVPPGSTIHRYDGGRFNYSRALNQGIALIDSRFTLIISAHTTLANPRAMAYALALLSSDDGIGGAYFTGDAGPLRHEMISRESFDGFNGLWNTSSVIRTDLARSRPFRPEVFSAEDQEWSRWWLVERGGRIARISGAGMDNATNPNLGEATRKRLNEYVAIAYFVRPDLLGPRNLASLVYKGLTPMTRRSLMDRRACLHLAARLARCRWRPPHYESRYFSG